MPMPWTRCWQRWGLRVRCVGRISPRQRMVKCALADVELENLKRFFSQIHLNAKQVGMERSVSDDLGSMILAVGL